PGQGQVEGFFGSTPVENLSTVALGVDYISRMNLHNPVIVAPNEACIQLAGDFAESLMKRLGDGQKVGLAATVEAGPSRGTDRYVHRSPGKEVAGGENLIEVVGDVDGEEARVDSAARWERGG